MKLPRNEEAIYYINDEGESAEVDISSDAISDEASSTTESSNYVDDSTQAIIDSLDWILNPVSPEAAGSSGDEGSAPEVIPDINPEATPEIVYKTVTIKTRYVIENFSPEALQALAADGGTFYAVYTDGTEDEVAWTEVHEPYETTTETVTFEADAIGAASNQYFWNDANGAHVTDDEQNAWNTEYVKANHGDLSNPSDIKPWHNILMNSLGILLRRGLINLVSVSKSAISFYDGSGNQATNVTALFGAQSAQIGRSSGKHVVIDNNGITAYDGDQVAPLNASNITAAEANIEQLQADTADISTIRANSAKVQSLTAEALTAATAYIAALNTASVTANDISADKATIATLISGNVTTDTIRAASAYISSLVSSNISASTLTADHASLGTVVADYLKSADMEAERARVATLIADYATVANLNAAVGRISNLESTKADISLLESDYIDADTIEANYLKTDISNATVGWIENGTIKNGAITNAMINSVSANKLTAGTIDASVINVTNLQADDISVTRINGQTVSGKTLVDALEQHEDDISDLDTKIDTQVEALNDRIDGAIETFTGTAVPTLTNSPASSWNTTKLKDQHVGDVYYVVNSNSQQNGYCYRFTKSGSSYSWQLIKDSDVTAALGRLQTAEGKISTIEQFDSDISSWKTDTDDELASIKSAATTLAGRVTTAEGQIATKVETSTFNTLSQTVNENSASISQLTTETTTLTSKVESQNPFIVGTQTAQTGNWTGNAPTLTSLVDGQQITYWLPFAGSGNASLNLTLKDGTTTGAIPCYYSGTTRLTTHYAANNAIHLTYRTNVAGIAQGWWADASYNTNTTYSKYSDTVVAGKNGLKRYTLCMRDDVGNFTSIVNQANNINASGKTCYTGGLQLGSVCYHSTGGDYAAGANAGVIWESYGGVDFRYSTNGITNAAATTELQLRKPVYLVGTIGADGLFYLDTTKWWTQTSFVEDKAYVFVGTAYSSYYAIFIAVDNPTYIYEDGELVEIQTLQINKTTTKVNTVSDTVDEHTRKIGLLETSVESKADGSTVSTISNKLNTVSDTVDGHTQSISSINSTLSTKADSSTVSTLSTKVNTIEDTVDGHTQSLQSVTSTQTSIQQNAVKSTVQLWFTKDNTTAPNKPTAHVTTNNAATGNAWNLAVPTYNASYPNYYYCYEYQYLDGSYGWSAVTRDIATGEMQERARTAIANAAAADTKASNSATAAANAQADIDGLEIGGRNLLLKTAEIQLSGTLSSYYSEFTVNNDRLKSTYHLEENVQYTFSVNVTTTIIPFSLSVGAGSGRYSKDIKTEPKTENGRVSVTFTPTSDDLSKGDIFGFRAPRYSSQGVSFDYTVSYPKLEKGNRATDWTPAPEDIDADISTAQTAADTAQATADKNVKESIQLWITKASSSAPAKPTSKVTSTAVSGNAWTTKVPTYNSTYPYYFYCIQYVAADGTVTWSDVVYDQATTEAQNVARTATTNLSTLQQDYATFKQTTQNFESTIGSTYATKEELSAIEIGGRNLLKNSDSLIPSPTWVLVGATVSDGIATLTRPSSGDARIYQQPSYGYWEWEADTAYVASIEARILSGNGRLLISPVGAGQGAKYFNITTEWERYNNIITSASSIINTNGSMSFYNGGDSGSVIQLRRPKLEKGNKPTDWSPAPEDINANISAIESRVTSAETSITQNNEAIALKANASDVYTKSQTDGLISTEVTNRNSAIEQSAAAINLSVSQTYTTKTEFNNLEIGGRNLFATSLTSNGYPADAAIGAQYAIAGMTTNHEAYQLIPVTEGASYICQYWVDDSEHQPWICIQLLDSEGAIVSKQGRGITGVYWKKTFTVPSGVTTALISGRHLAAGYEYARLKLEKGNKATDWTPAPEDTVSQTEFESAKSEIKATTDGITSTVEKINSAKYLDTTYSGYPLAALLTYSSEGYIGGWQTKDVKDAKNGDTVYLRVKDTTRNCYIYVKATVNSVNNNYLNCTSHGYEDVLPVETIKSTINQSSDSVKIQANHIEIDGTAIFSNTAFRQAADAAYDAKGSAATAKSEAISAAASDATTKANAVQINLDNLEIGGRNLFIDTDRYLDSFSANSNASIFGGESNLNSVIPEGRVVTISVEIDADDVVWSTSGNKRIGAEFSIVKTEGGRQYIGVWAGKAVSDGLLIVESFTGSLHKRISKTFELLGDIAVGTDAFLTIQGVESGSIRLGRMKVEYGTKATDWTPAPEDQTAYVEAYVDSSIDSNYSKIMSRGEQLIVNGNGFMGNNTNFSSFIFDGSVANSSPGSFTRSITSATVFTNEYFPVDASKTYKAEFDVKCGIDPNIQAGAKMYAMLTFYDVDKIAITAPNVMWFSGTTTTLAQDLKAGDTKVYLTDASNWHSTTADHQRALTFWNYTNSFGYTYPPETYSRNYFGGLYTNDSSVDKANGIITLKTAWTGTTYPAGTPVSQGHSGNNYAYFWYIINQAAFPTEWTHVSGTYSGTDTSGNGVGYKFWPGTAYCKFGWLWNYQVSSSNPQQKLWITNVSVKEDVSIPADTVKRTHRIYYRKSAVSVPATPSTAAGNWVTQSGDMFNQWTTKVPRLTANADGTGTKYLYLYTCEQHEMGDGKLAYTTVLLDDSTTVIDGGNIITGTVSANAINASSGTFNTANIPNLSADKITSGTIDAARIDASSLTIGGSSLATKNDVTNIEVGGRNLISGSGIPIVSVQTGGTNVTSYYLLTPYGISCVRGEIADYTVSYDWETTATSGVIRTQINGSPWTSFSASTPITISSTNQSGHYSKTMTAPVQWATATFTGFGVRFDDIDGTVTISNFKLERGNKATDWTPAPEDVAADISTVNSSLTTEINQRKATYGTCSTTASDATKMITCSNYELVSGSELTVKFSTANTSAGKIQFNVNGKGAKDVWVANDVTSATNQLLWGSGAYITIRYDGIQFIVIGEPRVWYGASTTAATTAAKTDTTVATGCVICKGTMVSLHMTNTNSVANPTLNIASTGAKAIYSEGSRPTATAVTNWSANATVPFVFDGQYWKYDSNAARKATAAYNNAQEAKKTATNYITADTNGIKIHMSGNDTTYQHQTASGTTFYVNDKKRSTVGADGLHVYVESTETEVASFTADGATIGDTNKAHMELDFNSLKLIDKNSNTYMHISDLRNVDGIATITDNFIADGKTKVFYLKLEAINTSYTVTRTTSSGASSSSGGTITKHTTDVTFASNPVKGTKISVTYQTTSSDAKAYTFGSRATSSNIGPCSVAEGNKVNASGYLSHAWGDQSSASGSWSFAGGDSSNADGPVTFAYGIGASSSGLASVALGQATIATEDMSFAMGYMVQATDYAQFVIGCANKPSNSIFVIGNGSDWDDQSNAFEVTWGGDVYVSRDLYISGHKITVDPQTETTGTITMNSTNCDSIVLDRILAYRKNSVVTVQFGEFTLSSALTAGSSKAVGTIEAGFRPPARIFANVGVIGANVGGMVCAYIDANGVITLINRSGVTLSTSVQFIITATYCV